VIVVDTSALIAVLKREPEYQIFMDVLGTDDCLVSSVSLLETSIVLAGGNGDSTAWEPLDRLVADLELQVRQHDAELTEIARDAFLRFGKGRHPARLNFGDCASYALARLEGCPLLFKGDDFARTDIAAAV
jgi:ribonuclease VapC